MGGAFIEARDKNENTPFLHHAAWWGHGGVMLVQLILRKRPLIGQYSIAYCRNAWGVYIKASQIIILSAGQLSLIRQSVMSSCS